MNANRIVHPGFWFGKTDREEALELAADGVGGFCIYGGTKESVTELIKDLRKAASHQLIISADYEDGLGLWLEELPLLPSNISIGAANLPELAKRKGFLTACQAKALGIDWVLAPVVDLADTPQNPIVNTRAFGRNAALVISMAKNFMLGLMDGGCLNSLKHFPGHGSTIKDSHLDLPVLSKTFAQLKEQDLLPYKELLTKADSIMVSHLIVKDWDAENPASFSAKIINEYLINTMHYKGLIVTDALMMGASKNMSPVKAFKAGADILLSPENPKRLLKDLKETITGNPALVKKAAEAVSAQEIMSSKLNSLTARHCKDPFAPETLSADTAAECICAQGDVFTLKPGTEIAYMEIDIYPKTDYRCSVFLDEFKEKKIKIIPYNENRKADILIITTNANYASFSGQINFTRRQKDTINKAVTKAKKTALISFASPFVNIGIEGLTLFLMAGTKTPPFQKLAAQIMLGKAEAKGKMPV
jgi:beta-glucosidase